MPKPEMRVCARCTRNRDVKFYEPHARRKDGLSTICNTCKRKKRNVGTRNQRLLDTYGITEADYQALLRAQGGVCAICGGKRPGNYDVDHDHKLGNCREAVRGLLCKRCNRRLLPAALDSVQLLADAIEYLQYPPAQATLTGS